MVHGPSRPKDRRPWRRYFYQVAPEGCRQPWRRSYLTVLRVRQCPHPPERYWNHDQRDGAMVTWCRDCGKVLGIDYTYVNLRRKREAAEAKAAKKAERAAKKRA